jgi:hypothetical protein
MSNSAIGGIDLFGGYGCRLHKVVILGLLIDRRMMPHFKDCIGSLDGTHISVTPCPNDLIRYIGRSGAATQNVLAIVDFDMRFTYASVGQPGSPLGMSDHLSPFFLMSIPMCMWLILLTPKFGKESDLWVQLSEESV